MQAHPGGFNQTTGTAFSLTLIDTIDIGGDPADIVFTPDTETAIVTNSGTDAPSIISFTPSTDPGGTGTTFGPGFDGDGNGLPDLLEGIPGRLESLLGLAVVDAAGKSSAGKKGNSNKSEKPDKSKKSKKGGDIDGDLQDAIEYVVKSLTGKYWTDATHPSPKHGRKVFDEHKRAVDKLQDVVASASNIAAATQSVIDDLIALDFLFATTALTDANTPECDAKKKCRKEISSAKKELDKAIAKRDAGDFTKSIDNLKKVWEHARKALDKAAGKAGADEAGVPGKFDLSPNYPNPFNPITLIRYTLPEAVDVRLVIFDVLGRRVRTLVDGPQAVGNHQVTFDALELPSGMYFYVLRAGDFSKTRVMILVK